MTCRPDEVLQAPVFWNSHHVGHEGSESDDRHRDDVRLRWRGWMQGPQSVWQMPIPEPMRLIQSPRPSPPCPQIREPPPAPSLQARGPTCNRFAAGCGQPVAWHLALGPLLLLHRGCWAAVDALPPSAARRQGRQLVAKRDCDSTLPFVQIHPLISQRARRWWSPNTQRDGRQAMILESKFELNLLFAPDQTGPHGLTSTLSHVSSSHDSAPLFPA